MRIYHDYANRLMKIVAKYEECELMSKGGSIKTDKVMQMCKLASETTIVKNKQAFQSY